MTERLLAVICKPFAETRQEENIALRRLCWDIDVRIEPFCLHADDFRKPYFALPYEVERDGVDVGTERIMSFWTQDELVRRATPALIVGGRAIAVYSGHEGMVE